MRLILIVALSIIVFFVAGCIFDSDTKKDKDNYTHLEPDANDSFAIYIVSDNISDYSEIQIEELDLLQPAWLSASDITNYHYSKHLITYSDSVWERLKTWGNLLHRIFVVTMGNERIYWGRFMDFLDSSGCQNPVIMLIPRHPDGRNTTPRVIIIERAYPIYIGTDLDPRLDKRIFEAFIEAGVLVP